MITKDIFMYIKLTHKSWRGGGGRFVIAILKWEAFDNGKIFLSIFFQQVTQVWAPIHVLPKTSLYKFLIRQNSSLQPIGMFVSYGSVSYGLFLLTQATYTKENIPCKVLMKIEAIVFWWKWVFFAGSKI